MMKPEIKCGTVKVHDTKKFRLRAVSTEFEVYAKYLKGAVAKKISYIQIGLAVIIAIAQICTVSLMNRHYTTNEYWGVGVCASILVSFAAGTTILASQKPNYCKLHSGMALHIVALLSHLVLVLVAVTDGLPRLSRHLTYTIHQIELRAKVQAALDSEMQESYTMSYYNDYRYQNYDGDLIEPVSLIGINIMLTALMSIVGVLQIVLSFTATIMTGRAMCSGRTNLEGKFFELDPVSLGSLVNYRAASIREKERHRHSSQPQKKEPISDDKENSMEEVTLSSPPSYESGVFQSAEAQQADLVSKA